MKVGAFGGQAVDVGSFDVRVVMATEVTPTPVVAKNEENVGLGFGKSERGGKGEREEDECFHEVLRRRLLFLFFFFFFCLYYYFFWDIADFDVPKGDHIAVVLETNMAFVCSAEQGLRGKFRVGDALVPIR